MIRIIFNKKRKRNNPVQNHKDNMLMLLVLKYIVWKSKKGNKPFKLFLLVFYTKHIINYNINIFSINKGFPPYKDIDIHFQVVNN